MCGDEHDAADLTQKTFSRAWSSLDRFQGRSKLTTRLHGIAYHVYLDWRRSWRPPQHRPDAWWETRACDGAGPFESAAKRDSASQIYARVEQLPDPERETVHLHYYQGLSLAETAEVLGIATSTVNYRLRNAVLQLKKSTSERPQDVLKS